MKIPEKGFYNFLLGQQIQFMWLLDVIKPNISLIVQNFGYKNYLFLVLIKLKLGLINQDLAI